MRRKIVCFAMGLLIYFNGSITTAGGQTNQLQLEAADSKRINQLVHLPIEVPDSGADSVAVRLEDGKLLAAQISGPWLLDDPEQDSWITFVVPEIAANVKIQGDLVWGDASKEAVRADFSVSEDKKSLLLDDRPLLTLEDAAYDNSSPEQRDLTYKVFHHFYMPGIEQPITKGPGGLYPHHRGLFYGFNKIGLSLDGKSYEVDTWHAKKAYQISQGVEVAEAGGVFARQVVNIDWMSEATESVRAFAVETREYVVFKSGAQVTVQFSSRLQSKAGEVSLKGDPQHAGFQFRASQEVADMTKSQTYYVRPDGSGKPGEYRNWPDQETHVDLPFQGMSFVVGGKRLTCLRLDRAQNPHPARYSERDYGRFGSYFEHQLVEGAPLDVQFQLRFQPGEISVPEAEQNSATFWKGRSID